VTIVGEGKEKAGADVVKMTMHGKVATLPDGGSELSVKAEVLLTGKIVRFGRGMIHAVSAQLFKDFAARLRTELELPDVPVAPEVPRVPEVSARSHAVGSGASEEPPDGPRPAQPVAPADGGAAIAAPPAAPGEPVAAPPRPRRESAPVSAFGLLFTTIWSVITQFLRRLVSGRAP
jgi:hypothetical protein